MPGAEHCCGICGKPADLALTEIVSPHRAVVTRHFCEAHRPPEVESTFSMNKTMKEIEKTLRDLQERIERELEGGAGQ
jgi:hypothetical protein